LQLNALDASEDALTKSRHGSKSRDAGRVQPLGERLPRWPACAVYSPKPIFVMQNPA
jgi:hypothetical protein